MSSDEKMFLITEIHDVFYQNISSFENTAGSFLAYLYPAIASGEKCQLWGSDYEDIVMLLFLQNNFSKNHKIWEYIECMEKEQFVVDAKYCTKWKLAWEFDIETHCYYNVFYQIYYGLDDELYDGKGECIEEWLVFELELNDLFDNDYVFRVKNPQKMCELCGENINTCLCQNDNE